MRLFIVTILLAGFASAASAAPSPDLWKYWNKHVPDSKEVVDHSAFSDFLKANTVKDEKLKLNRIKYGAISAADKKKLKSYITSLEKTKITQYNRAEQRAYWINLYNAATVKLVVDKYPVDTIRDIGGGLFSGGPWDEKLITVEGKAMTLNDIEHRVLRPIWKGPLTHYGVNCASIGCPNLLSKAYTAENLEESLRANAKAFVNSPRGVRFDDGDLQASKIYDWFAVDFGNSEQALITHLRQFAEPALSAKLDAASGIDSYYYDWSLNGAK